VKNTIVVYYSLGGNTEFVAESIISELKCDKYKIEIKRGLARSSVSKYFWAGVQAMFNRKVELSDHEIDFEKYENIVVGSPVWSNKVIPPVKCFFEKENLKDKNIFLFYSYGAEEGNALEKLSELFTGNKIIYNFGFKTPLKNIDEFSRKIEELVEAIKGKANKMSREEILRAGKNLIIEKGYEKTKIEEIMKSIGSAKGGFYYYFDSKKDLMIEIMKRDFRTVISHAISENDEESRSSRQKLEGVLSVVLGQSQEKYIERYFNKGVPDEIQIPLDNLRNELLLPIIIDLIETGNENGEFNVQNVQIVSDIIFRGISSFIHDNYSKFSDDSYYKKVKSSLDEIFNKILVDIAG